MEILLEQRFSYAKIGLVKNYCKLEDKSLYDNSKSNPFDNAPTTTPIDLLAYTPKRNQSAYFIEKVKREDLIDYKQPLFECVKIQHETISDKQIKRHYNNPFANVTIEIFERTIRRNGDKILLTNTHYTKQRRYNSKYFKSYTEKSIFTFDFKTGNFQVIKIQQTNKDKKRGVRLFRTNNFILLKNSLQEVHGIFRPTKLKETSKFKFQEEINEALNDREYRELICKLFDIEAFESLQKLNSFDYFYDKIQEQFIKLRKIKVPNHSYDHLLMHHYPKEKFLKKNDRKLIASVLDMYGVKSKFTIKLIHKYPYFEINTLALLCNLFGNNYQKYISSIDDDVFSKSQVRQNASQFEYHGMFKEFKQLIDSYKISDEDKENVVRILNDPQYIKYIDRNAINDLVDHFRMIDAIRVYDPSVKMKAKTQGEFLKEHRELSKTIAAIKKGWVIKYQYDDKTTMTIEEPIRSFISHEIGGGLKGTDMSSGTTLYPHILKREEEYVEEGGFMHHCVASYADKEKSIIVSIRTEDQSDRVTCEFDIQSGRMIQARHFCNAVPPEMYNSAIETVQDKIRLLARFGTLNWKEKKKVPIMINGVEVKPSGPRQPDDLPFLI